MSDVLRNLATAAQQTQPEKRRAQQGERCRLRCIDLGAVLVDDADDCRAIRSGTEADIFYVNRAGLLIRLTAVREAAMRTHPIVELKAPPSKQ